MVTTKNLLIIFAVLLLLLTLLSAFGGSIHPVENFDFTNNPITGGNSAYPKEHFNNRVGIEHVNMESNMPTSIPDFNPAGPAQPVGPSAYSDNLLDDYSSINQIKKYPTATIETFVEPFEDSNELKSLYATV